MPDVKFGYRAYWRIWRYLDLASVDSIYSYVFHLCLAEPQWDAVSGNLVLPSASEYTGVELGEPSDWDGPYTVGNETYIQYKNMIAFPQAQSNWGTVTHWALRESSGLLAYAAFPSSFAVVTGDKIIIPNNSLRITLAGRPES